MKKLTTVILMFITFAAFSQRGKPKMLPIMADGYYINTRNDTVKGKIQTNLEDPTDFYKLFYFKNPRSKKPKLYNTQRAKGYGVDGRDFVVVDLNGEKTFIQRIVTGRLNFYQREYNGKIDGYAAVESDFFIRDNFAEGSDSDLKELKKISGLFYKRALKPYLKDQPMLWDDLDKFNFDEKSVVNTIKEFNGFYAPTAN
jgi:hypothetical protein